MHDGITFEQLGKRAVVLCTEPFEVTAKNIARVMGMPDYPFVILDHPLGSCTIEEIRERAKIAADAAVEILTT
ncbi:MAG: hypothetical protein CMP98_08595 [Gammaproteobacteria bacterium]|nr:hypothetical protein [Gammaproteobacteria bacterium]OUU09060.1 MAG: hypothetical protein CBB94_08820 [Gammaproteobacteria bacterium TMED34]